jgi:hypothetical protein
MGPRSVSIAATTAAASAAAAEATTASAPATAAAAAAAESTASAAAATTTAVSTTATAAGATLFAGPGFVDSQGATAVLLTVEGRDRRGGFIIIGHFDETETLTTAGVAVIDDLRRNNLAMLTEELLELRAVNVIAQIPHVQLLSHFESPLYGYSIARPHNTRARIRLRSQGQTCCNKREKYDGCKERCEHFDVFLIPIHSSPPNDTEILNRPQMTLQQKNA